MIDLSSLWLYQVYRSSCIQGLMPKPVRHLLWHMFNRIIETRYVQHYIQWKEYLRTWEEMYTQDQLRQLPEDLFQNTLKIEYDNQGIRAYSGWHNYGSFWWFDPRCPYAFKYARLDDVYPEPYFDREAHPQIGQALQIYRWMQEEYQELVGRPFRSVLELGTGGGQITEVFYQHRLDFVAVEGSTAGCKKMMDLGIPPERIVHADLRTWQGLDREFDLVMCTEVVEHIEMPFLGHVVEQACRHAGYVWFSSPTPGPEDSPKHLWQAGDYEHCSCWPLAFWDNLFAFFGFSAFVRLNPYDCTKRGMRLYYVSDE
jgi:2-polyprenyl-3-methyl-5-hydroxy-6-metoxy-1,4-benzoquinol methylase